MVPSFVSHKAETELAEEMVNIKFIIFGPKFMIFFQY